MKFVLKLKFICKQLRVHLNITIKRYNFIKCTLTLTTLARKDFKVLGSGNFSTT